MDRFLVKMFPQLLDYRENNNNARSNPRIIGPKPLPERCDSFTADTLPKTIHHSSIQLALSTYIHLLRGCRVWEIGKK